MRTTAKRRSGKWNRRGVNPLAVIIPVLVTAFIIAVIVGNALRKKAETVESLLITEPDVSESEIVKSGVADVRLLPAGRSDYRYDSATGKTLIMRDINGVIMWDSYAASMTGLGKVGENKPGDTVSELVDSGEYISACFFSLWQGQNDAGVRRIYRAFEISLLSELAAMNVNDIVIFGLDVTPEGTGETCEFLADARRATGKIPIGTAISVNAVEPTDDGRYLATSVRKNCDFLALDLRINSISPSENDDLTVEKLYSDYKYYIQRFSMRLLLDENTAPMAGKAEDYGVASWQIIE